MLIGGCTGVYRACLLYYLSASVSNRCFIGASVIGYHVVSSLILRILASRDVEFAGVTNWATVRLKPTALTPISSG